MIRLLLPIALLLSACVSHENRGPFDCGVPSFAGELTDGLISPTVEMKESFLSQLDERDRGLPYCWYQSADGQIELTAGEIGHIFSSDGEEWNYVETRDYIVLWHERNGSAR